MNQAEARKVLDLVFYFQTRAQEVERYGKNPFVLGDSIAEHLARGARLIAYIAPALRAEFPDRPKLVEELLVCFLVHDDEEVIDGYDIATGIKRHNADDEGEIAKFAKGVSALSAELSGPLVGTFSSFRNKDTLAAWIAKAVDNIVGNQLVIEQQIGLVNPDSARFCIEYAQKVLGHSKTIDMLVAAQIEQIVEWRERVKNDPSEIERAQKLLVTSRMTEIMKAAKLADDEIEKKAAELLALTGTEKIRALLEIDVLNHALDKSKMYVPIDEL